MRTKNILSYLKLDSFGVELQYSKPRTDLIRFFYDNDIPVNMSPKMQIVVKSKLLSLDVTFCISFQFDDENLIAITMTPDTNLEGKTLFSRYGKIQKALESELGHPCNYFRKIMNLLDPQNRSSYWFRNGVKVEHYLLNRFGMEEIINIRPIRGRFYD